MTRDGMRAMATWLGFMPAEVERLFITSETAYGRMRHLRAAMQLANRTDAGWRHFPAPPSRNNANWLDAPAR